VIFVLKFLWILRCNLLEIMTLEMVRGYILDYSKTVEFDDACSLCCSGVDRINLVC
jgi:hypothetical protein